MSHKEYLSRLDESQLHTLIEMAKEKLKQINETGWVRLWVVSDDGLNHGWFPEEEYSQAVAFLTKKSLYYAEKYGARNFGVELVSYRPLEAERLVADTKDEL